MDAHQKRRRIIAPQLVALVDNNATRSGHTAAILKFSVTPVNQRWKQPVRMSVAMRRHNTVAGTSQKIFNHRRQDTAAHLFASRFSSSTRIAHCHKAALVSIRFLDPSRWIIVSAAGKNPSAQQYFSSTRVATLPRAVNPPASYIYRKNRFKTVRIKIRFTSGFSNGRQL